jgi:uncharacterized membrane protein
MKKNYVLKKLNNTEDIEQLVKLKHSQNINVIHSESQSFGDRVSDKMADVAGSWKFIITFAVVLFLWISLNSIELLFKPFDPFPFILLNLVLSCVAAMQAPVIMMSQNRQEAKDRIRAEHDYEVNLKAEILIEEVIKRLNRLEENQNAILDNQKNMAEKSG